MGRPKNDPRRLEMFQNFFKSISNGISIDIKDFIVKVFMCFPTEKIDSSHAHNWLYSSTNQSFKNKFSSYAFQKEHYKNFLDCFNTHIGVRFTDVQKGLSLHKDLFQFIIFDTIDQNVFFCSLLKQFLYIVDIPVSDNETLNQFISQTIFINSDKKSPFVVGLDPENPGSYLRTKFLNGIIEYKITYYINNMRTISDIKILLSSYFPCQAIQEPDSREKPIDKALSQFQCYYFPEHLFTSSYTYLSDDTEFNFWDFSKKISDFLSCIKNEVVYTCNIYNTDPTYLAICEFCELLKSFCFLFSFINIGLAEKYFERYEKTLPIEELHSILKKKLENIEIRLTELKKQVNIKNENIDTRSKSTRVPITKKSLNKLESHRANLVSFISILSSLIGLNTLLHKISDGLYSSNSKI